MKSANTVIFNKVDVINNYIYYKNKDNYLTILNDIKSTLDYISNNTEIINNNFSIAETIYADYLKYNKPVYFSYFKEFPPSKLIKAIFDKVFDRIYYENSENYEIALDNIKLKLDYIFNLTGIINTKDYNY